MVWWIFLKPAIKKPEPSQSASILFLTYQFGTQSAQCPAY